MRLRAILFLALFIGWLPVPVLAQTPVASAAYETRYMEFDGKPVTLSPDGQWIAGVRDEQSICIWDIDDVTPTCAPSGQPIETVSMTWSPDSRAVAFSTGSLMVNTVNSDVFIFDVASGMLRNLTADPRERAATPIAATQDATLVIDTFPAWSPDGASIAFARSTVHLRASGGPAAGGVLLMTMSCAGEDVQSIGHVSEDPLAVAVGPLYWLPGGTVFVTTVSTDPDNTSPTLHQIDLATGSGVSVIRISQLFDGVIVRDVSNDGQRFSLSLYDNDYEAQAILDAGSGNLTVYERYSAATGLMINGPLSFSPDGSDVAYRAVIEQGFKPAIAIGLGDPLIVELVDEVGVQGAGRALDWAANGTILVPFAVEGGYAATLVTLR